MDYNDISQTRITLTDDEGLWKMDGCLMDKQLCATEGKAEASSRSALPKQENLQKQFTSMRKCSHLASLYNRKLWATSSPPQSSCELCSRQAWNAQLEASTSHPNDPWRERDDDGIDIWPKMEGKGCLFIAPLLLSGETSAEACQQKWETWVSCGGSDGEKAHS